MPLVFVFCVDRCSEVSIRLLLSVRPPGGHNSLAASGCLLFHVTYIKLVLLPELHTFFSAGAMPRLLHKGQTPLHHVLISFYSYIFHLLTHSTNPY